MTKCVFLAAGSGTRLRPYTDDIPKCLLPFRGTPLLSHLIGVANACGITDVVVVRGYSREKINFPGIRYVDNTEGHNMLHSLFCADAELRGDVVVSYTDILYEPSVMRALLASTADISVVVDLDWKGYYGARAGDPYSIAETLVMDEGRVLKIGAPVENVNDVQGQYIGLMKFSAHGVQQLRACYWENRRKFWGQPWQQAQRFEWAYMTDILQALVDQGTRVDAVPIERGWLEFDSPSDYENALSWDAEGSLARFINL